jgi:hypothetical protein
LPFNGAGVFTRLYSWVSDKTSGIKINATRMDAEMDGIATALSNCITKDGQTTLTADIPFNSRRITGLGNATADADALNRQTADARYWRMAQGTDIASATTTDIGAAAGAYVKVTGTTTITGLGTAAAGVVRIVTFTGSLTLTHNATSLILPGAANITTLSGDVAEFVSEGGGNWRCINYQPNYVQTSGLRNRIINGNFAINKRAVSGTVTLAAGAYGHDRWKAGASGCTYTFAASGSNPVDTAITITSGSLIQVIEGREIEGGVYTLSWTGTATGRYAVNGGTTSGSYAAGPIVTSSATAAQNITVEFTVGTLTRVQFEPGSGATSFERRSQTLEESLCARYFQALSTVGVKGAGFTGAIQYSSDNLLQVPMRVIPTVTYASAALYNSALARTESGTAISISTLGHGDASGASSSAAYMFATYSGAGTTYGFVARDIKLDAEI